MIKALFKDESELDVQSELSDVFSGQVSGVNFEWDILKTSKNSWHVIDEKGNSFHVVLESLKQSDQEYMLKIDGNPITVVLKSEFDQMLEKLGISASGSKRLPSLKAPMPGLVLDIAVKPGDEVKQGEQLVVLEAMKMENVIKAPQDVKIKEVKVSKSEAVEKGEIILVFE